MQQKLKHEYPGTVRGGKRTVGGNQRHLDSKTLQHCGCGVVAVTDLVRYLHLYHASGSSDVFSGVPREAVIPVPVYDLCVKRMRRQFIPVTYPVGTTGFALAIGLNRYFRCYDLPLKARWGVKKDEVWQEIDRMLDDDLPVILSVGNRFPCFWKKDGAAVYRRVGGAMEKAGQLHAHYVTVLEMDDRWLKIASWGKEYFLSKEEFLRYRDENSLNLLCNIVSIRRLP